MVSALSRQRRDPGHLGWCAADVPATGPSGMFWRAEDTIVRLIAKHVQGTVSSASHILGETRVMVKVGAISPKLMSSGLQQLGLQECTFPAPVSSALQLQSDPPETRLKP